jgi:hypothetical protein
MARSRGLGDVYKRQRHACVPAAVCLDDEAAAPPDARADVADAAEGGAP